MRNQHYGEKNMKSGNSDAKALRLERRNAILFEDIENSLKLRVGSELAAVMSTKHVDIQFEIRLF